MKKLLTLAVAAALTMSVAVASAATTLQLSEVHAEGYPTTLADQEFARLVAKLDALSPLKVLGRGYSIALDAEGRAVREAGQLKAGDKLDLRLSRGGAKCLVESVYGGEDNGCKEKDL